MKKDIPHIRSVTAIIRDTLGIPHSRMASMLSLHSKTAAIALLPLLIWGAYRATVNGRQELDIQDVEIGIEHAEGAVIRLTRSIGGETPMVDIQNSSTQTMYISLPDNWTRGEVRNAPLASLIADAPSFGYRRWALPANADVTFHPAQEWRNLTVHNASPALLQMTVIVVDLARDTADTDVYLIDREPLSLTF